MSLRYPELDVSRSLAILMMVVYHIAFDLAYYRGWDIDLQGTNWQAFRMLIATMFLSLAGISFAISWERTKANGLPAPKAYLKYAKRSLFVLSFAMLITAATYISDPSTYIRFGILHMIGTSILLLPLFRRLKPIINVIIGIAFFAAEIPILAILSNIHFSLSIFHFPLMPAGVTTLDYYPLIPWFGIILLGTALGDLLYVRATATAKPANRIFYFLGFPGRHTLLIYMIHQPIILSLLKIFE